MKNYLFVFNPNKSGVFTQSSSFRLIYKTEKAVRPGKPPSKITMGSTHGDALIL